MIRARMLRENGKYLPKQSFLMRRHFFNNEESGYLKTVKRASPPQPMTDPNMMVEMLKGFPLPLGISLMYLVFVLSTHLFLEKTMRQIRPASWRIRCLGQQWPCLRTPRLHSKQNGR